MMRGAFPQSGISSNIIGTMKSIILKQELRQPSCILDWSHRTVDAAQGMGLGVLTTPTMMQEHYAWWKKHPITDEENIDQKIKDKIIATIQDKVVPP